MGPILQQFKGLNYGFDGSEKSSFGSVMMIIIGNSSSDPKPRVLHKTLVFGN